MTPYGYRIERGKARVDDGESEKLLVLFKAYASGLPFKDCIAKAGIEKSPGTCKDMLSNQVYLGTDFYPPIIPRDLFDDVQEELERRKRPPRSASKRIGNLHVYTGFTASPAEGNDAEAHFNPSATIKQTTLKIPPI